MCADGIHLRLHGERERWPLPALVGVHVAGTNELVALTDEYRDRPGLGTDRPQDAKRRRVRDHGARDKGRLVPRSSRYPQRPGSTHHRSPTTVLTAVGRGRPRALASTSMARSSRYGHQKQGAGGAFGKGMSGDVKATRGLQRQYPDSV